MIGCDPLKGFIGAWLFTIPSVAGFATDTPLQTQLGKATRYPCSGPVVEVASSLVFRRRQSSAVGRKRGGDPGGEFGGDPWMMYRACANTCCKKSSTTACRCATSFGLASLARNMRCQW